jgi:hypothetical protein
MESGAARARTTTITVGLFWLVMFLTFLLVQFRVSFAGNTYLDDGVFGRHVDANAVRFDLVVGGLRYLGASLAMVALIVGQGRRALFALPVVMTVWLPAFFGGVPGCTAWDQSTGPHGIGAAWSHAVAYEGCGSPLFAGWGGALVDLAMVLAPAIALAAVVGRTNAPGRLSAGIASKAFAGAVSLIALTFLISAREVSGSSVLETAWIPIHLPLVAFGALLGMHRSRWSLALLAVPLALFPLQTDLPSAFDVWEASYLVAITAVAAAWVPLATLVEMARPALARLSRREVAVPAGS